MARVRARIASAVRCAFFAASMPMMFRIAVQP
jgi:hypothetical protein